MSTTHQFAAFVQQIEHQNLPETVVAQAKNAILDTLGVILAGATTPVGNIVFRYAESFGGATSRVNQGQVSR